MKNFILFRLVSSFLKFRYLVSLKGATAIEYALMAAGIALAISVIVFTLGDEVALVFQDVEDGFAGP